MSIRKYKNLFIALLLVGLALIVSNKHYRWLILNGLAASELSNILLNQQRVNTPSWAVDLVVVSNPKEKVVSFSEHDSEFTYVYSPIKAPVAEGYSWKHIIGSWHVGKTKT